MNSSKITMSRIQCKHKQMACSLQRSRADKAATLIFGLHTLVELQAGIPEGVDVSRKEDYLSDDEFLAAFGMSRGEFRDCKKWKQTSLKKKVGIY